MTDEPPLEDQLLAAKPYTDEAPPPTLESRAGELVDAMMHELMRHPEVTHAIGDLPEPVKEAIDRGLFRMAVLKLREIAPDLVGETATSASVPAVPVNVSGQPLEPEIEGAVYQVQVGGGLLLSQQKGES